MKNQKRAMIISLLVSFVLISCISTMPLNGDETVYEFNYDVNQSKNQIRNKLLQYVNERFYSAKHVIQTNEDGILAVNITVSIHAVKGILNETIDYVRMTTTLIVNYEDNKCSGKWIVKAISTDQGGLMEYKYWGHYRDEIKQAIIENNNSIKLYLIS